MADRVRTLKDIEVELDSWMDRQKTLTDTLERGVETPKKKSNQRSDE